MSFLEGERMREEDMLSCLCWAGRAGADTLGAEGEEAGKENWYSDVSARISLVEYATEGPCCSQKCASTINPRIP